MRKILFSIACMILLVASLGNVSAGDYIFQNSGGANLTTIKGDTGNLSTIGNISAQYFFGSGQYLTGIATTATSGVGIFGYIPMWNSTTSLNNSNIFQLGSNIGIGTTNPQQNLHIYDATSDPNVLLTRGDTSSNYSLAIDSDNSFRISENIGAGTNDRLTILTGGSVGIGTTSPAYALDVNASTNTGIAMAYQNYLLTRNATGSVFSLIGMNSAGTVIGSGAPNSPKLQFYSGGGSPKIVLDTSGNVGIGTESPAAKLEINAISSEAVLVKTNTQYSGIKLQNATGSNYFAVYPNAADLSDTLMALYNLGAAKIVFRTGGNSYFNAGYNVGINTTTPQNTLNVVGDANITGTLYANGQAVSGGDTSWTGSGSNVYNATTGIKVGIGTASPQSALDINASASPVFLLRDVNSVLRIIPSGGTNYVESGINLSSGWGADLKFTNMNAGTTFVTIKGTTGNVGIGTESPGTTLEVNKAGTGYNQVANFIGSTSGSYRYIKVGNATGTGASTGALYGYSDTGDFAFVGLLGDSVADNGVGLIVKKGGNIGIGTTNPYDELEVNGSISLASGNDAVVGGERFIGVPNGAGTWGGAGAFIGFTQGGTGGLSNDIRFYTHKSGITAGERMRIDEAGNVGIGTTSPDSLLDINGTGVKIKLRRTDYDTWTISQADPTGSNKGFGIYNVVDGVYRIFIDETTNNVGIGTINPISLLHINGSVSADYITRINNSNTNGYGLRLSTSGDNVAEPVFYAVGGSGVGFYVGGNNAVGIGTTTPQNTLNVVGTANITGNLYANGALVGGSGTVTGVGTQWYVPLWNGTTSLNNSVIYQFGSDIGIGITGATQKLEVQDTEDTIIRARAGNSTGGAAFYFANATGTTLGAFGEPSAMIGGAATSDAAIYYANNLRFIKGSSEFMRLDTNGNLGIGTTNPQSKLHLADGQLQINVTGASNEAAYFGDFGATTGTFGISKPSYKFLVFNISSGNSYFENGNVGIGTTTPDISLDVASGAGSGKIGFYDDATHHGYINTYNVTNANFEFVTTNLAGGDFVFMTNGGNGGNVGIGTTTPTYNLDIDMASGNSMMRLDKSATGNATIDFSSDTTAVWRVGPAGDNNFDIKDVYAGDGFSGDALTIVSSSGRVGINTTAPTQLLDVKGGVVVAGKSGATSGGLQFGGYYTTTDILNTYGSEYSTGGTVVGFAVKSKTGAAGFVSSAGNTALTRGALIVDNGLEYFNAGSSTTAVDADVAMTSRFRIDSLGNVGINTTTPQQTFNVVGNANVTGNLYANGQLVSGNGGTWGVSGSNIYNTTHNVGIGTATPTGKLDVAGSINITGGTSEYLTLSNGVRMKSYNTTGAIGDIFTMWTDNRLYVGGVNNDIIFRTRENGNNALFIASGSTSNVGIGTATPANKLEIAGGTAAAYKSILNLSESGTTADSELGIDFSNSQYAWKQGRISVERQGSSADFDMVFQSATTGALVEGMRIDNAGKVGIGTTSPATKLHVNETGNFWAATINNAVTNPDTSVSMAHYQGYGMQIQMGSAASNIYGLEIENTAGNQIFGVYGDGKVGIGTATPTLGKLTIVGSPGGTALGILANSSQNSFALNPQADGSWILYDYASGDWTSGITQKSGKVGIGTTAPQNDFNVVGNANITGTLYVNNAAVVGLGYTPSRATGNGTNSVYSLDSRNTNYNASQRDAGLYMDFKSNAADGLGDGGSYHGVLTFRSYGFAGDFSGGYPVQIANTVNGNLWIRTATGATTWGSWTRLLNSSESVGGGTWAVSGSNIYNTTHNVGIGTASPSQKLEVVGKLNISGNRDMIFDPTTGNISIAASSGGWSMGYFFEGVSGTEKGGFGAYGNADSLNNYYFIGPSYLNPYLVVNGPDHTSPGRVGIGTSTPSRNLELLGTANLSSTNVEMRMEASNVTFLI